MHGLYCYVVAKIACSNQVENQVKLSGVTKVACGNQVGNQV
jgi:hypothetical protein